MFRTRLSTRRELTRRLLLSLTTLAMLAGLAGGLTRASARAAAAGTPGAARTSHGTTTVGVYGSTVGTFYLRNSNTKGIADLTVQYGPSPAITLCGIRPPFVCPPGWFAVAGDWDGDGIDTVGLYYEPTGFFFLRNSNSAGPADLVFQFGPGGFNWSPMAGDWDGNGLDNVGVYNHVITTFYLRNTNTAGPADIEFTWAPAAGTSVSPLAGDWDADGTDTVGLYAPFTGRFFMKVANAAWAKDFAFNYGPTSSAGRFLPVAGDWDGL